MNWLRQHTDNILNRIPEQRMLALDVFRGITITAMILVNNPGSWSHIYAPFKHAKWHGWTPTDLIFPFFIFIVGVSISLSIGQRFSGKSLQSEKKYIQHLQKSLQQTRQQIILSSTLRMFKLLLLGWFLSLFYYRFGDSGFNWIEDKLYMLRVMGVLQRIGIVYFCTVLLFLFCRPKTLAIWAVALMIIYTLVMQLVPYADDSGTIYQGLWLKGNNLCAWVDHNILGLHHVYSKTKPLSYDPEGLLGTLTAISTCLSGVLIGLLLQQTKKRTLPRTHQLKLLLITGILGVVSGQIMHHWLPINKALWTPSFVLLSSGLACLVFAVCIYLVEIRKNRQWSAPFIVFGANSIAFFMFAGIVGRLLSMITVTDLPMKVWLYNKVYMPVFGALNGSFAFAISFLILSYFVMHWMYRKRIFWKV